MINSIFNPYARGIVRVAPIREDIDTTDLTPENINLYGEYVEFTMNSITFIAYLGKEFYTYNEETGEYVKTKVTSYNWKTNTWYQYEPTNLLEPIQDIVDICGTNPSEINYSKNTSSSEESGRTQGSYASGIFLNMHKDILGRVRDIEMTFPPMFLEKYSKLDDLFMNKTQNVKTTGSVVQEDDNGNISKEDQEIDVNQYIIWYYVELLLPETGEVIKDIYYVGDSSFTGVTIEYRNIVTETDENGNPTKIEAKPFAKNLKIKLIGKCAINSIANI